MNKFWGFNMVTIVKTIVKNTVSNTDTVTIVDMLTIVKNTVSDTKIC